MGRVIGPPLKDADKEWILEQRVFFHATAPLSKLHRINVSPKSSHEFRIIDESTVAWLDLTGSGSETSAHILENGRLTILFVALRGSPKIVRLHGTGSIVLPSALPLPENVKLFEHYKEYLPGGNLFGPGFRCIVVLKIERASQSCGYSIPIFEHVSDRTTLEEVTAKEGCEGMKDYRLLKNSYSIDGLPSIAQLEMAGTGTAPVSLKYDRGYIFTPEYGSSKLQQWLVRWELMVKFGPMFPSLRDSIIFTCGALVGSVVVHNLKRLLK